MKEFINNLLSDSPKVSSKRFTMISGVLMAFEMVTAHICGKEIDPNIFWSTITLICMSAGLTVAERFFPK